MIVIGFVILALAVAAAITAIAQNQSAMVEVHGLGYTWNVHLLWVFVAGLVVAFVGFIGIAMMRTGAAHAARLRSERRGLARENARLSDAAANPPVQPVVAQPAAHRTGRNGAGRQRCDGVRTGARSTAPRTLAPDSACLTRRARAA